MKTQSTCPDLPLLSQFCDHEIAVPEEEAIHQHIATCTNCQLLIARLQRATETGRTALTHSPGFVPLAQRTTACLSPETVAAYVQRLLPADDQRGTEQHLQTCSVCFNEVKAAFRVTAFLAASTKESAPAVLKTQAAALWQQTTAVAPTTSFSRVVIQLAEKGLQLLEQHLVAPFFSIQEILAPAPTYRSTEAPKPINLKLAAGQHTVALTITPDGHGIALTLVLLGPQQEGVSGQRIFLSRQGRSVLSRKTDQHGALKVSHLEPGIYEIACAGMDATFAVELRA